MIACFKQCIAWLFNKDSVSVKTTWDSSWTEFLLKEVVFYQSLNQADQLLFNKRVLLFLDTTRIESYDDIVTDQDRLLIAASAVIPVWGFPKWHYFNLKAVHLMPASFNANFQIGQADSVIAGMVGTGLMSGKMVLSKPDLHQGFSNHLDKKNVGIHEFTHLIDMADGECDGYPERLKEFSFSIPWFEMVEEKINDINENNSNIRKYGATNRSEFFAVASEYFFERPRMLNKKHPELFKSLTKFYKQDVLDIGLDIKVRKKSLCACGSGKRYKRCCMPKN